MSKRYQEWNASKEQNACGEDVRTNKYKQIYYDKRPSKFLDSSNRLIFSDELKNLLSIVLSKAIPHSYQIARRETIKAIDRHERVNLFVNYLRTTLQWEMQNQDHSRLDISDLTIKLCNKALWYDIGEVEGYVDLALKGFLSKITGVIVRNTEMGDDPVQSMWRDLAILESHLPEINKSVKRIQQLTAQGEQIAAEFVKVLTDEDD